MSWPRYLAAVAIAQAVAFGLMALSPRAPGSAAVSHTVSIAEE